MTKEQLDLLIIYINTKVELSRGPGLQRTWQLQDKLVSILADLEKSCNED